MKKNNNKEFKLLVSYIETLQSRYFHTICAFYAWEGMKESFATNIIGKENAIKNAEIISKYKGFLTQQENRFIHTSF